mgnify:CR=1 FL=1
MGLTLDGSKSFRITTIEVTKNPRYPYKPPIPLTVVVNPVVEPLDDEQVEVSGALGSRSHGGADATGDPSHVSTPGPPIGNYSPVPNGVTAPAVRPDRAGDP